MPLMLLEVMILAIKLLSQFFKNENASNNFTVADMSYFFYRIIIVAQFSALHADCTLPSYNTFNILVQVNI